MGTLWQDVLYAIRTLRKSPGFLITVLVILTLGIGVNTAVFSVVNAVALRPLPYENPDRLVVPWEKKNGMEFGVSLPNFILLREQNRSFEYVAAYGARSFYITGIDRPHQDAAIRVSSSLFSMLGVPPLLGRTFLPREEQSGNDRVMVLSYAFWRDHLGGTPEVIGKTVNLDDQSYTIVGVMPPEFRFPFRKHSFPFWVPLVLQEQRLYPVARLKKGVTLEQARGEMAVLAERLREMDPVANADITTGVDRLLDEVLQSNRRLLWLLLGAAGCVLLVACGNVANLFLARAGARQREVALRVALGASRARVMRQMLTESILLSVTAGLLGLLVTFWTVKGLVGLCPATIPRLQEAQVDTSVLVFTLAVSMFTGLLFSTMPAWRSSDVRTAEALKEGPGASAGGPGWRHLGGGLVIAQIGVSLVLLMGAGLLIRTLMSLQKVDLGFQPRNMMTLHIELPATKYPEPHHCQAFFEPLVRQVRALPGVRAAGLVFDGFTLGTGGSYQSIRIDDRLRDGPGGEPLARYMTVSPGFFEAMGVRTLKGRIFTEQDMQAGTKFVVIDEHLARTYFSDTDPLGHQVNGKTIIGVVSTLRDFLTLTPTHDTFFTPLSQSYSRYGNLVVRLEGDPMVVAGAIRSQIAALDKDQTAADLETMETTLSGMMAPRRFTMILLGLFAGIALILAMMGVYGLLQYRTTRQIRDMGIRMALGARRMDLLRMVITQGLWLILAGLAVGLAGALALTRLLSSLLYGVTPLDPLTFALVSLLLACVALLASYLPARRAARIDPMAALRCE
jgi:predicted permease